MYGSPPPLINNASSKRETSPKPNPHSLKKEQTLSELTVTSSTAYQICQGINLPLNKPSTSPSTPLKMQITFIVVAIMATMSMAAPAAISPNCEYTSFNPPWTYVNPSSYGCQVSFQRRQQQHWKFHPRHFDRSQSQKPRCGCYACKRGRLQASALQRRQQQHWKFH
jgi:hypothetical protein